MLFIHGALWWGESLPRNVHQDLLYHPVTSESIQAVFSRKVLWPPPPWHIKVHGPAGELHSELLPATLPLCGRFLSEGIFPPVFYVQTATLLCADPRPSSLRTLDRRPQLFRFESGGPACADTGCVALRTGTTQAHPHCHLKWTLLRISTRNAKSVGCYPFMKRQGEEGLEGRVGISP